MKTEHRKQKAGAIKLIEIMLGPCRYACIHVFMKVGIYSCMFPRMHVTICSTKQKLNGSNLKTARRTLIRLGLMGLRYSWVYRVCRNEGNALLSQKRTRKNILQNDPIMIYFSNYILWCFGYQLLDVVFVKLARLSLWRFLKLAVTRRACCFFIQFQLRVMADLCDPRL